jgi:hypothetical protein
MATAKHTSMPAPVGGLNDRTSFVEQKPNEAVVLENWFPYTSYVGIRKGSQDHVTGLPATIETLVEYAGETGVVKLFAAAGTAIYDVTNEGVVGAPVVTGMANARWQETMITTPGGSFLIMCNGANAPRVYNGSTWSETRPAGDVDKNWQDMKSSKGQVFISDYNGRLWYFNGYSWSEQRPIDDNNYTWMGVDMFACDEVAPTPMPTDGKIYSWSEKLKQWLLIENYPS